MVDKTPEGRRVKYGRERDSIAHFSWSSRRASLDNRSPRPRASSARATAIPDYTEARTTSEAGDFLDEPTRVGEHMTRQTGDGSCAMRTMSAKSLCAHGRQGGHKRCLQAITGCQSRPAHGPSTLNGISEFACDCHRSGIVKYAQKLYVHKVLFNIGLISTLSTPALL
jgi:hypothetical protein